MSLKQIYTFLTPYFWPSTRFDLKLKCFAAFGLLVLAKIASLSAPLFLGRVVDSFSLRNNDLDLFLLISISLIAAYTIARLSGILFSELREICFSRVSQHAIRNLTLSVFEHLFKLPMQFHVSKQTGGLNRLVERGAKSIDFLLRYVVFSALPTFIEVFVITIIIYFLYGWKYGLISLLTMTAYVYLSIKITEWRLRYRKEMNSADNLVSTRMVDSLLNFETVKYFNNEKYEAMRLDRALGAYEIAANKSRFSLMLLNLSQNVVVSLGISVILVMAAFDIRTGVMTVGGFFVLNAYMLQLSLPLTFLGTIYREIKTSLIDMENMFALASEIPDEEEFISKEMDARYLDNNITLQNVCFNYDGYRKILNNVSLTIADGEKVAFVGPSGSGKTTIGRLIFGFYRSTEGQILIGKTNIDSIPKMLIRKRIAVVPQDTVLFNETIFHNIAYGNVNCTHSDVEKVAKMAGLIDFIQSLPDGYETIVGERGLKLSGGEKQRVGIARALLKNPSIFIFDEATSSLDSVTEKQIQNNIEEVTKGITTIMIAHRLSTVVNTDQIYFLDQGKITEQGSHQSLLKLGGQYSKMWKNQRIEQKSNLVNRRLATQH